MPTTTLVAFRLDVEKAKKVESIASAKEIKRPEALREAVDEYIALYIVGAEPTLGRLQKRVQDIDKRLSSIEDLLKQKGAQNVTGNE